MKDDNQEAAKLLDALEWEQRLTDGFENMDARVLAELTDRQLAILQAKVPRDSPQFIRADQEWQRRLTERQLRSERFAVWMGVGGTLAGTVLGWILSKL